MGYWHNKVAGLVQRQPLVMSTTLSGLILGTLGRNCDMALKP